MRITLKLTQEIERRKLIKRMRSKLKYNNWRKLKEINVVYSKKKYN